MHERALISELVDRIVTLADGGTIRRIELALGPSIHQEVAGGMFAHVAEGTPAAGAEVVWRYHHDTLTCFACSTDFQGSKLDTCPRCDGPGLVVDQAEDVELIDIEVA